MVSDGAAPGGARLRVSGVGSVNISHMTAYDSIPEAGTASFFFHRQLLHLVGLVLLVPICWAFAAPALGRGEWLGFSDTEWFWASADDPPGWGDLTDPSTGTLAAWAEPKATPPQDCEVPISSPYRGLDNRLYRVEIHDTGRGGNAATFKWSRENASVAAATSEGWSARPR